MKINTTIAIKSMYYVITFLLCIIFIQSGYAQSMEELNSRKEKIREEIEMISGLIDQTTESLSSKQERYNLLIKRRDARKELLNTLNSEIASIQNKINQYNAVIDSLDNEINKIKDEYAHLARQAYRWKKTSSPYLYILSAESMNQAFRRYKFIQQFEQSRKEQREEVKALLQKQEKQQTELEKKEEEKISVRSKKKAENRALQQDINSMNTTLNQLRSKRETLKEDLKEQKRAKEELDIIIAKVIAREKEKENDENTTESDLADSPESRALASEFTSNKGKLPWPVKKGFISRKFGRQPHPTLKNLTVDNNGIDITTEKMADVYAVFKGKVIGIVYVPGYQKMVILKHGNYYSVYSRLDEVYVEKGMQVETGSLIGNVFYDKKASKSQIHIEIWQGKDKLNPAHWLLNR